MTAESVETRNSRIKGEMPGCGNIWKEPQWHLDMWGLHGNHLRQKNKYKQRAGGK